MRLGSFRPALWLVYAYVPLFVLISTEARAQHTGVCYDASAGTLPQEQGWTYSGDGSNPSPYVSGGVLHQTTTAGAQYWTRVDGLIDFSQHVTLAASLRVNASNYVPNVGTGTREGYYFYVDGQNQNIFYAIGLADSGFDIDGLQVPNQALTPFAAEPL